MSKAKQTPIIPLSMNETILLHRICKALDYDIESIPSFGKPTYVGVRIKGKSNPKEQIATIKQMFGKYSNGSKLSFDKITHSNGLYCTIISKTN